MTKTRSIRIEEDLDKKVEEFVKLNGIKFNQAVAIALEKLITEKTTIELTPVKMKKSKWSEMAKKGYKKHAKTMKELS